jgi:nucleotide-binding universal stress UspA family protein
LTPAEHTRLHAHSAVLFGSAPDEIQEYARRESIDLIVMGTHGRGGVAHALMGSVAEKVVRSAACPVLTVR